YTTRFRSKKTRLAEYDSPRQSGLIAINFRDEDDALIGAKLVDANDDLVLFSKKGQAIRFTADDEQLRPMGRATSGVTGMKFRGSDELLSMSVIRAEHVVKAERDGEIAEAGGRPESAHYIFTATDGGYAKKTLVSQYRVQGRGGLGIKAMKLDHERGTLVGAVVVSDHDEVLAIKASGQETRTPTSEVTETGRDTMGVRFVGVNGDDEVVAIARNEEKVELSDTLDEENGVEEDEDANVEAMQAETSTPDPVDEQGRGDDPQEAERGTTSHGPRRRPHRSVRVPNRVRVQRGTRTRSRSRARGRSARGSRARGSRVRGRSPVRPRRRSPRCRPPARSHRWRTSRTPR